MKRITKTALARYKKGDGWIYLHPVTASLGTKEDWLYWIKQDAMNQDEEDTDFFIEAAWAEFEELDPDTMIIHDSDSFPWVSYGDGVPFCILDSGDGLLLVEAGERRQKMIVQQEAQWERFYAFTKAGFRRWKKRYLLTAPLYKGQKLPEDWKRAVNYKKMLEKN